MQKLTTKWTGIRPIIMHNGALVDRLNPYTVQKKELMSKGGKNMTDADFEQLDRLEWFGALYHSPEIGLYIPSDAIERVIQLGGQKSRIGKNIQAAVFCSLDAVPLDYVGSKDLEELYNDPDKKFQMRKGVCVQKNRVMRVRPMIPTGWNITFDLEYDDTVVDRKALIKAMEDAGSLIGLFDWRPKFGRFLVEVLE